MHTRFSFLWSYTIHSTTVAWSASVLLSPEKAWGHRWAKIKSWNAIDGKTDCEAEANWTSELSSQEREPLRHINRHGVTNGHQQSNWQNQKMKAQNIPPVWNRNQPHPFTGRVSLGRDKLDAWWSLELVTKMAYGKEVDWSIGNKMTWWSKTWTDK